VGVAKKFENLKIVQISGVLRAVSSDADGLVAESGGLVVEHAQRMGVTA
jgi:hypothetical protein